jgi:hypothetical protein
MHGSTNIKCEMDSTGKDYIRIWVLLDMVINPWLLQKREFEICYIIWYSEAILLYGAEVTIHLVSYRSPPFATHTYSPVNVPVFAVERGRMI